MLLQEMRGQQRCCIGADFAARDLKLAINYSSFEGGGAADLDFGGVTGHHEEARILPQQDVVDAAAGGLDAGDVPASVRLPDPYNVLVCADDALLRPACIPGHLSALRQHRCMEVRSYLKFWAKNLMAADVLGGAVHAARRLARYTWVLTFMLQVTATELAETPPRQQCYVQLQTHCVCSAAGSRDAERGLRCQGSHEPTGAAVGVVELEVQDRGAVHVVLDQQRPGGPQVEERHQAVACAHGAVQASVVKPERCQGLACLQSAQPPDQDLPAACRALYFSEF